MTELNNVYVSAVSEAARAGVQGYVVKAHAWATYVLAYWGFDEPARPDITSGYRSPERQAQLLRQWERGDRWGLRAKPACRSYHTTGWAIDVQTGVEGWPWYHWLLVNYTSAQSGIGFGDEGHLDWRQFSPKPPDICAR